MNNTSDWFWFLDSDIFWFDANIMVAFKNLNDGTVSLSWYPGLPQHEVFGVACLAGSPDLHVLKEPGAAAAVPHNLSCKWLISFDSVEWSQYVNALAGSEFNL